MKKIELKGYAIGALFLILQVFIIRSAKANQITDFDRHAPLAKVIQLFSGVPASVQLAQAYCETNFGARDTIGFFDKKLNRIRYLDTIGYHYSNIFAIMDFEGDYWEFGSKPALGCWGKRTYIWRRYAHPTLSWIDHAYFFMVHNPSHLHKPWWYWCANPVRYGRRGYWNKIRKTIIEFGLDRYDL